MCLLPREARNLYALQHILSIAEAALFVCTSALENE